MTWMRTWMLGFGSHMALLMEMGPHVQVRNCGPCQPCRPLAVQEEEKMPTSQEMAWSRGGRNDLRRITSATGWVYQIKAGSISLKVDGRAPSNI